VIFFLEFGSLLSNLFLFLAVGFTGLSVSHFVALTWRSYSHFKHSAKKKFSEEKDQTISRRDFLRLAVTLTGGIFLASVLGPFFPNASAAGGDKTFCHYRVEADPIGNCGNISNGDEVCIKCIGKYKKDGCPPCTSLIKKGIRNCILVVARNSTDCSACIDNGTTIHVLGGGWKCT